MFSYILFPNMGWPPPSFHFIPAHSQLPVLSINIYYCVSTWPSARLHVATCLPGCIPWFSLCNMLTEHSVAYNKKHLFLAPAPVAPEPTREGDAEANRGRPHGEAAVQGGKPSPLAHLIACLCHACYHHWLKESHTQVNPQLRGGQSTPGPWSHGIHADVQ